MTSSKDYQRRRTRAPLNQVTVFQVFLSGDPSKLDGPHTRARSKLSRDVREGVYCVLGWEGSPLMITRHVNDPHTGDLTAVLDITRYEVSEVICPTNNTFIVQIQERTFHSKGTPVRGQIEVQRLVKRLRNGSTILIWDRNAEKPIPAKFLYYTFAQGIVEVGVRLPDGNETSFFSGTDRFARLAKRKTRKPKRADDLSDIRLKTSRASTPKRRLNPATDEDVSALKRKFISQRYRRDIEDPRDED